MDHPFHWRMRSGRQAQAGQGHTAQPYKPQLENSTGAHVWGGQCRAWGAGSGWSCRLKSPQEQPRSVAPVTVDASVARRDASG